MSRVIKFRAWDGTKMHTNDAPCSMCGSVNYNSDYQLMQFTGLRDCNRVEIYEGDILEFNDFLGIIFWNIEIACFRVKVIKNAKADTESLFTMPAYSVKHGAVIGDIYQTPELLS